MRTIIWIFIGLVCLIPVAFITLSYIRAPSRTEYKAAQEFISICQQHVDDKVIDINAIEGDDVNAQYVRIYAEYLNKLLDINNRLAKVKNGMVELAQPGSMAAGQSIYEMQEKQSGYEKEIISIRTDLEAEIQSVSDKMGALDKTKIKTFADPTDFVQTLNKGKPERDQELGQYDGLAQYVKTLLEFINTRKGMYQLGTDGALHFTHPEDQQYYNNLISGINQYTKIIEDLRQQHNKEDRKLVNDMSLSK